MKHAEAVNEFWENKFHEVKTSWGMEPSDAAIVAKDFFLENHIRDILIPGVGYGRNAGIFLHNGINVTGIEISDYAIILAKQACTISFPIYHGSVTDMPFDNRLYDGIFCYALIHLLNQRERKQFIRNCYNQLRPGGYMVFSMVSTKAGNFGQGKPLSHNRYKISKGMNVYFYDIDSANKEFIKFGLEELREMDEPVKFLKNEPPLKCIFVKCKRI